MNRAEIFTNAHKEAKSLRRIKYADGTHKHASYAIALSIALKKEWKKAKSPYKWDLMEAEKFEKALELISEGAKFNGKIYTKHKNKNWTLVQIYVDGNLYQDVVGREPEYIATAKAELQANINAVAVSTKSSWLINGEHTITNNLSYGEMYDRYGMDFE